MPAIIHGVSDMKEVGTLREIGARVGDVVYSDSEAITFKVERVFEDYATGRTSWDYRDFRVGDEWSMDGIDDWHIIRRATSPFNTLTAEEKGSFLLANHQGKIIEMSLDGGETWDRSYTPQWIGAACYRVKADEVELVSLAGSKFVNHWGFGTDRAPADTHCITFSLVNGKPDCASVKMEALP